MSLDCKVKQTNVDGVEAILLGFDETKGADGGGYTYLKSVLQATINRDSLPNDCKPIRPETPLIMNVSSLYLTYAYDPKHTDFTSGLQIKCYTTGGGFPGMGRSYIKIPPGNIHEQIAVLPESLQRTITKLLRTSDPYDPRLGVSELLSKGQITQEHLARFAGQDSTAKLDRA